MTEPPKVDPTANTPFASPRVFRVNGRRYVEPFEMGERMQLKDGTWL